MASVTEEVVLNLILYSRKRPGGGVEGTVVESSSLEHQRVWISDRVASHSQLPPGCEATVRCFFPQQHLETSWSLSVMMAVTIQCTWTFHTISLKSSQKSCELGTAAAAAAAKSLQSCPILCDPIDGSPRGSPVPGILQARTLEWVAISFSNA